MSEHERPGDVRPLDVRAQFDPGLVQDAPTATPSLGKCLACIVERKGAEIAGKKPGDLPPLRDAIALFGGSGHCYDHILVRQQSPLQLPGPQINGFGG